MVGVLLCCVASHCFVLRCLILCGLRSAVVLHEAESCVMLCALYGAALLVGVALCAAVMCAVLLCCVVLSDCDVRCVVVLCALCVVLCGLCVAFEKKR